MNKLPNLSGLRAFEAAARRQSFVDAADELGVTPAAISRAVRRLEAELGIALFHRAHRSVSLTEAGARYAQQVTDGFRQLSPDAIDRRAGRPRVTLAVEATLARQWLLPRLKKKNFTSLDLSLSLHTHHDQPRVLPRSADLAIVWGSANHSGFRRQRLVSPRTILVASPDAEIQSLEGVAPFGLIHEADEQWWRIIYEEAGLPYPDAANSMTLDRCDLPIAAACLGLGVAVGDDVIAENELRSGTLVPVPGPRIDGQDYYLLQRTGLPVPAKKLAKWLIDEAAEFANWQADCDQSISQLT